MAFEIRLSDHFTYRRILRFCFPTIVMMAFTSVYGVVDGLFVSNCVGTTAFAGMNLIYPFLMVLGGVGFMIGTGGSALVAKTLGEGDRERANRYFSMMIYLTIILGVLLGGLGAAFIRPISYALGATEEMIDDCVLYGRIVGLFTFTFMLQTTFQTFLTTAEKPKLGLYATLAAGFGNMILDALFVGLFGWGLAGAAYATGISQCIGGVLPMIYFIRKNDSLLQLVPTGLSLRVVLKACGNGVSELMSNISGSIVGMIYNFQLIRYAGEKGVAAYGVLMYVCFIFIAIYIGYTIGVSPVVGFNFGAGNRKELKSVLGKSIRLMVIFGAVMTLTAIVLAQPFAKIFVGYDAELMQMTKHAFRIYAISFLLSGFNIFSSAFFTALNNGAVSAIISFLRTLGFQLAAVLILPLLLGLDGIWWAVAVAEVFACILSIAFLLAKRKRYGY